MMKLCIAAAAIGMIAALIEPLAAQPVSRPKVGMLTCRTSASVGLVVGSRQRLACRFRPDNGGPGEGYYGIIRRLGLDLGVTAGGALAWAVFARTNAYQPGSLAGRYAGASGDISLGLGAGANVLVGGSNNTVSLQPLSVEGQVG